VAVTLLRGEVHPGGLFWDPLTANFNQFFRPEGSFFLWRRVSSYQLSSVGEEGVALGAREYSRPAEMFQVHPAHRGIERHSRLRQRGIVFRRRKNAEKTLAETFVCFDPTFLLSFAHDSKARNAEPVSCRSNHVLLKP
jgi:hypothetical protein